MEDVPPSYELATTRNHWTFVAPYIQSSDLCSVSRVCTAWHAIFQPFLWGNPASHFGTENDRVYGEPISIDLTTGTDCKEWRSRGSGELSRLLV